MPLSIPLSDNYRGPLRSALVMQCVVVILSVLMLDFGISARIATIAMAAFWGGVLLMMARRPRNPTANDLWLIRYGFLLLFAVLQVVARCVWHWQSLN